MGGMLRAIESGAIAREIEASSVRYQQAVDSGEKVIVGLNRFQSQEAEEAQGLFEADPKVEARQKAGLAELKRRRSQADVHKALVLLEEAIAAGANVMPAVLAAVKAYATVGEICAVMRRRWGEYRGK
jgi:methylmalonyl-CoA mutase N-terminal domain/subunit